MSIAHFAPYLPESQGASLAAPAEVGQVEGTLSERFPSPADSLDQFISVVRETGVLEQLRFISQSGNSQLPVVAGDALKLLADEVADKQGCIHRDETCLFECLGGCLIDRVSISYRRSFLLLIHVLSEGGKV